MQKYLDVVAISLYICFNKQNQMSTTTSATPGTDLIVVFKALTAQMNSIEAFIFSVNKKYNFDPLRMKTARETLQLAESQTEWERLRNRRDAIKTEAFEKNIPLY